MATKTRNHGKPNITRIRVARFIEYQMHNGCHVHPKSQSNHYGWQELKLLMDYIFNGSPGHEDEELDTKNDRRLHSGSPDPRGVLTRHMALCDTANSVNGVPRVPIIQSTRKAS